MYLLHQGDGQALPRLPVRGVHQVPDNLVQPLGKQESANIVHLYKQNSFYPNNVLDRGEGLTFWTVYAFEQNNIYLNFKGP